MGADEYLPGFPPWKDDTPPYDLLCCDVCGACEAGALSLDRFEVLGKVACSTTLPGTLFAAAIFVDGLGLLDAVGLACLLEALLLLICPCHILMPEERLGPMIPVLPGFPADVGDSWLGVPGWLVICNVSGIKRFSALPRGLDPTLFPALLFANFLS